MKKQQIKGYTLVELMIVIVIIGMLASIILPHMVKGRYQAQFTSCQANLRNLASALEIYHTDKDRYPDDTTWQDDLFKASGGNPPYMQPEPTCPSNSSKYGYIVDDKDFHNFTLYCNGVHHIIIKAVKPNYPQYNPTQGLDLGTN